MWLAVWYLVAVFLGYVSRMGHDVYLQNRRERALHALSGELPDWEKRARELEDWADRHEIEGRHSDAKDNRQKAARLRRVARRRLSIGRTALPS